jgi:predicted DNA-binding protein YlxM (UPF0122 family)
MVKLINQFFKTATRADVNDLLSKIILSERQTRIFEMFYLRDMNIGFIADSVNCSPSVISEELKIIRDKIERAMSGC